MIHDDASAGRLVCWSRRLSLTGDRRACMASEPGPLRPRARSPLNYMEAELNSCVHARRQGAKSSCRCNQRPFQRWKIGSIVEGHNLRWGLNGNRQQGEKKKATPSVKPVQF